MKFPADFGPSALTIGNFDGVHTGHRSILRRVKQIAADRGWKPSPDVRSSSGARGGARGARRG